MTDHLPVQRRFALIREVDHTGVSGVGAVADGVMDADGTVALRWRGDHRSWVLWGSLDDAVAVHGHDGATRVHWFDDEAGEPVDPVTRRKEAMDAAHSVLWAGGDNPTTLQAAEVVQLAEWLMYGQASYEMPRPVMAGVDGAGVPIRKHNVNPPF